MVGIEVYVHGTGLLDAVIHEVLTRHVRKEEPLVESSPTNTQNRIAVLTVDEVALDKHLIYETE